MRFSVSTVFLFVTLTALAVVDSSASYDPIERSRELVLRSHKLREASEVLRKQSSELEEASRRLQERFAWLKKNKKESS
jgi:hypothetical protein